MALWANALVSYADRMRHVEALEEEELELRLEFDNQVRTQLN